MSCELPPELWLEVFKILPRRLLPAVHAVSSLFSQLSCPLLFSQFEFYPPQIRGEPPMISNGEEGALLEREFDRLAFWSSKKFAPLVRKCTVNLTALQESIVMDSRSLPVLAVVHVMSWFTNVHRSSSTLMLACFEAVSRFTNLQELICHTYRGLVLELPALRVHALPSLKFLHIHTAHLVPSSKSPSTKLRIEHFSYTEMTFPEPGESSQMHFLDSATLRRIDLQSDHSMFPVQHFLEDKVALASFHNLHVVNITVWKTSFAELHTCLSALPAVRELGVDVRRRSTLGDLPSPATPIALHLTQYRGPADLLPLILRGTAPHALEITRDWVPVLLLALRKSNRSRFESVTTLLLQAQYPDIAEGTDLANALTFFPALDTLIVGVESGRYHEAPPRTSGRPRALCDRLSQTLAASTTLRTVTFNWGLDLDIPWEHVPRLHMLEAVLLPAVPGLKSVVYLNAEKYYH
ncbi:hypothetical protein C8J57DRAFT_1483676 [Mycena rebaudengoi]|nr:hypothetical protein C8J57DRAFT_1483676 [Mycena rebaudengoi]